jgi:hypothetical protein
MLKKHYLVTKKIFQVILYLTEMIGISYLLTKITSIFLPTENFIDFFERMTIFFTFYQIIIFGIFQQLNDMKKDEYLAILTMYKYVELYNSDKREYIAKDIKNLIQKQLDSSMLNDNDIRNEYLEIKKLFENNQKFDDTLIKIKIIKYEHCCEEATLNWKFSILTRLLK